MVKNGRFTEIDFLRFLAAVAVMFFHYTFLGAAKGVSAIGIPSLAWIFKYGYLGVDLFFMISGFVILMSAIDRSPKSFVISRIVRLYPAFWICCSLTFLMTVLLGKGLFKISLTEYLLNLTMLHSIFHVESVDGSYWSLLFEIVFYCLIFILIASRQLKHVKYYLGAWLAVSIVFLEYPIKYLGSLLIPEYSAYFIAGAVFFLISREKLDYYKLIIVLGSYALAIARAVENVGKMNVNFLGTEFNVLIPALFITAAYIVFFLIALDKTAALRSDRFLLLGAVTYPLYLIHQRAGFMIFNALHESIDHSALVMLTIALMLSLALIVHICIEKKFSSVLKLSLERQLWPFRLNKKAAVFTNLSVPKKLNPILMPRDS